MTILEKKFEAAQRLAKLHFDYDPGVQHVYMLTSPKDAEESEPIKLLEVVEGTFEAGVYPIHFKADPEHGINFGSVIVEVSPKEFSEMRVQVPPEFEANMWQIGTELANQ
ncbi:MAG: hypothetical protein JSS87_03585 [Acidobacteria bacterium]|nr:hypothetical protein [Acidobacteriota bacterium]